MQTSQRADEEAMSAEDTGARGWSIKGDTGSLSAHGVATGGEDGLCSPFHSPTPITLKRKRCVTGLSSVPGNICYVASHLPQNLIVFNVGLCSFDLNTFYQLCNSKYKIIDTCHNKPKNTKVDKEQFRNLLL